MQRGPPHPSSGRVQREHRGWGATYQEVEIELVDEEQAEALHEHFSSKDYMEMVQLIAAELKEAEKK